MHIYIHVHAHVHIHIQGGIGYAIHSISPTSASVDGGVRITLHGHGFKEGCRLRVKFAVPHAPPPLPPLPPSNASGGGGAHYSPPTPSVLLAANEVYQVYTCICTHAHAHVHTCTCTRAHMYQ